MRQRKSRTVRALLLAVALVLGFAGTAATGTTVASAHAPATGVIATTRAPAAYTGCEAHAYAYWNGSQTLWGGEASCSGGSGNGYKAFLICIGGTNYTYLYGPTRTTGTGSFTYEGSGWCYTGSHGAAGIIFV